MQLDFKHCIKRRNAPSLNLILIVSFLRHNFSYRIESGSRPQIILTIVNIGDGLTTKKLLKRKKQIIGKANQKYTNVDPSKVVYV